MSKEAPVILGTRRFDIRDQEVFARLSGDGNPIHMDALAARRSIVGDVVVHGIHTVLWALEQLAQSPACPDGIGSLEVQFPHPVYLGEEISLRLRRHDGADLRLAVVAGDKVAASIRLGGAALPQASDEVRDSVLAPPAAPRDIAFDDLAGQHGTVPHVVSADDFVSIFPTAAARFGAPVLRDLAACSQLVGVYCPGLRSVFSRLALRWHHRGLTPPLEYRVTDTDSRFSMVTMTVGNGAFDGTIQAFSPPPPPSQPSLADLARHVAPDAFAGQTALVVGGSRGLGELTAKAIAAGGGRTWVTYAVGRDDAERVVEEIRRFGGESQCFAYDVTQPAATQLAGLGPNRPSHVYYFATGYISRARTMAFDAALLERFMAFYVQGYHALLQALWDGGARDVTGFYPSSVFVTERPRGMTEYAMAKAAGEILVADLETLFPGYRSHGVRLPRLLTDQTAEILRQGLPPAIDVLLPELLAIRGGAAR
ncbi:Putative maoC domain-containing protein dehydratase [Magnetospirillum sp. XM-1]|uniref:SDR family NAD(P)-dependent oxidoreductase n=1 Tax=Magnetospirillum sp. XM-1 TaxID=1663591 RepID=UPI00073DBFAC|nr:SDR family NAD(P)-dependent oxidoreductase [Magnetospirillum sp. XM-1]CUW38100.1 Putative maoC domain-containing protein dehydratase [Magnetospirillum sp. XM-1]